MAKRKKSDKPKYKPPFCECNHHPGPQRSYCVCRHVMDGAPVDFVELATDKSIGAVLCDREHSENVKEYGLVCEGCVIERGWLIFEPT